MPKVGDKEFPYTEAGERQANIYANQTGRKVEYDTNTYGHGSYQEGGEVGDDNITSSSGPSFKELRGWLIEETEGLARLIPVTNKETGETIVKLIYAGTKEEAQKYSKQINKVNSILRDYGNTGGIQDVEFMTKEDSEKLTKYVGKSLNKLRGMQQGGPVKKRGYGY